MTDVRCVWLTRDQRDIINYLAATATPLEQVVAAWDAAPADPAEAAREAILLHTAGNYLTMERSGKAAAAVLRALGHPKEPA